MQTLRLIARRAAAMAIDIAVLFLVLAPLGGLVLWMTGLHPVSGPQIYAMLLLNFSIPSWAYFIIGDGQGQTLGKKILRIRVLGVGWATAVPRTAVKLLAWELVHVGMFALAPRPGEPGAAGWIAVAASYGVLLASLLIAGWTGGRRSLHDAVAGTHIETDAGMRT